MSTLKPKDMAKKIGVSVATLQRWDREGILIAHRTPTDRRFYTEEQYDAYINRSTPVVTYTTAEMAKQINVSERTIHRWVQKGLIEPKYNPLKNAHYYTQDDVDDYLNKLKNGSFK